MAPVAGGPYTLNQGEDGRQPTDFRTFIGYTVDGSGSSDRYNFAPVNYLQTPQERFSVTSLASYEIKPGLTAYAKGNFVNSKVVTLAF